MSGVSLKSRNTWKVQRSPAYLQADKEKKVEEGRCEGRERINKIYDMNMFMIFGY